MISSLPKALTYSKGQIVLIVLLVLSVLSVVGLSVVSRSVTDVKISQQSQEAARALWVAQGELEKAMKANIAIGEAQPEEVGGVKVWVSKSNFGGGSELLFPDSVAANDPVTLWLVEHKNSQEIDETKSYSGNQLTFYWGETSTCDASSPALEATLIYKDNSNDFQSKRFTYDCLSTNRSNFSSPKTNCSLGEQTFAFCSGPEDLNLPANYQPYFVSLRLLFNASPEPVGVKGDQALPTQGSCFESSAQIPQSGVTRKLRQCQHYSVLPKIFDFTLFSGGNI